jgi:hypothetical protein
MPAQGEREPKRNRGLLRRMSAHCQQGTVEKKVIPFQNEDVPKYLRNLRRFERMSRRVVLVAR